MGNRSGGIPEPRRGDEITASMLGGLWRQIVGRFVAVHPLKINQVGDTLSIGLAQGGRIEPSRDRVQAEITSETGSGVYEWSRARGAGPETGSATELDLTTGISIGTKVWLFKIQNGWWFQSATATDVCARISFGGATDLSSARTLAVTGYEIDEGGFQTGGGPEIPEDGFYSITASIAFSIRADISGDITGTIVPTIAAGDKTVYENGPVISYEAWVDGYGRAHGVSIGLNGTIYTAATAGQAIGLRVICGGASPASMDCTSGYVNLKKIGSA